MPKLIPNDLSPGDLRYLEWFKRNFIKVSEKNNEPPHWLMFEKELLEREDVRKSIAAIRRKVLKLRTEVNPPQILWYVLSAVLMECAHYADWNNNKFHDSEIYRSQDIPRKLAREIRKIKNSAMRLLKIDSESEEPSLYHYANKSYEKDPFLEKSYPDVLTDKQVMKALDILSGFFDRLNGYLENGRRHSIPFSGVEFPIPKSRGKRKDILEYSLVHSLKRIFMDNIGEGISPVIAVLRNATFPKKKPIDARRVRDMLQEIDKDPNCIKVPTTGYLA